MPILDEYEEAETCIEVRCSVTLLQFLPLLWFLLLQLSYLL